MHSVINRGKLSLGVALRILSESSSPGIGPPIRGVRLSIGPLPTAHLLKMDTRSVSVN